jgi:glucan endo-1,3-alpha-glucosidase
MRRTALNIAQNDYEANPQLGYAFAAAQAQGHFSLFLRQVDQFFVRADMLISHVCRLSFDMTYTWAASDIENIVAAHATSSAYYKWNSSALVSTFSGSSYGNTFYAGVKSSLASKGIKTTFAPAFTDYRPPSMASQLLSTFPSVDGFFNWWSWYVTGCFNTRSML